MGFGGFCDVDLASVVFGLPVGDIGNQVFVDQLLPVKYSHLDVFFRLVHYYLPLETLLAVLVENNALGEHSVFGIRNNSPHVLRMAIIDVKLFDSEGDAEIGCSQCTAKGHRLVSVDMRAHLNRLKEVLDDLIDERDPAGSSDDFHGMQFALADASLLQRLLQFLGDDWEHCSLFEHFPLDDHVEVDAIDDALDVDVDLLVSRQHFLCIRALVHELHPGFLVSADVQLVLGLELGSHVLSDGLVDCQSAYVGH